MAGFGIGAIKIYQSTFSKIAPPRCRYNPSCSQYGIEAIQEWGLIEGIKITRKRIARCHRPNSGYDPVPRKHQSFAAISRKNSEGKTTQKDLDRANFETISHRMPPGAMVDYQHHFRLILSYPRDREFLSMEDFRNKIAEFNHFVFQVPTYALMYRVSRVEVGAVGDYYLLRFAGTISETFLENSVDEIIYCLTAQLAGFLLAAQEDEFLALYFQVDGQVFISPKPQDKQVPQGYKPQQNFWDFTSDTGIWDVYWGDFVVEVLAGMGEVAVDAVSSSISDVDLNSDGCDGCDLDGCGSDNSGDLDIGGCDTGGCDVDGCDGGGCDGCDVGGCDGCS